MEVLRDLMECSKLEDLPSLRQLTNLRELTLRDCKSIRAVLGLSDLVTLEELEVSGCSKLHTLPDLVKFTKLEILNTMHSPVQGVPGLGGLISPTTLCASFGDKSRNQLMFSKLSALKMVEVQGWNGPIWPSLQNLAFLEDLCLWGCKGSEHVVPNLQNLKRLRLVLLDDCMFKSLSGLSNSTALETLWVHDCDELVKLPEFQRLSKLTDLSIKACHELREWPSESSLYSLKSLEVDEFSLVRLLQALKTLKGIRNLRLWRRECESVLTMVCLTSQVKTLEISRFSSVVALDLDGFRQLKELELRSCRDFKMVTCSNLLTALTEMKVEDCKSLVEIPDLSMIPHLEKLRLKKCSAVTKLTCSRPVTSIRKIKLIGCNWEVETPDFRVSKFEILQT